MGGDTPNAIRNEYSAHGVEGFYQERGHHYRNPHEPQVENLLRFVVPLWGLNLSHVLDLAAGSGEVTLILRKLGAGRIDGVDPYTFEAFQERTGQVAERVTFEQIAAGAFAERRYSLIVCSFALHLLERSRLPSVAFVLSRIAPALLVLTPNKRPEIRSTWGWKLADELMKQRVRARLYFAR